MSAFQAPATMRAVVYKGPYEVAVEDKPYPRLQNDTDCVLKVTTSALCGSDLHFYRGQLKTPAGFVCGHEFVGEIVEKGDKVQKFGLGEKVSFIDRFLFLFLLNANIYHSGASSLLLPKPYIEADSLTTRSSSPSTQPAEPASTAAAARPRAAPKASSSATPCPPTASTAAKQSMCACRSATRPACAPRPRFPRKCSC
jgi:NADPH:quinone reductase-like Zn-dependent oxidoreductase